MNPHQDGAPVFILEGTSAIYEKFSFPLLQRLNKFAENLSIKNFATKNFTTKNCTAKNFTTTNYTAKYFTTKNFTTKNFTTKNFALPFLPSFKIPLQLFDIKFSSDSTKSAYFFCFKFIKTKI
jgi:hypothetical protein